MPQNPPSRTAFMLALRLAGHSAALISGLDMEEYYPESGAELLAAGGLIRAQPLTTILLDGIDGEREVDLEWRDDLDSYADFTVRGWKRVPSARLARYQLRFACLPEILSTSLALSNPLTELIPSLCWDLGLITLRKRRVRLYFARQVEVNTAAITDNLRGRQGNHATVLLSAEPVGKALPGIACLSVSEVLDTSCLGVALNLDMLANAAFGQLPDTPKQALMCLEDGHLLFLNGREFRFRGDKHAAAVKFLADAYYEGESSVRVATLLEAIGASITMKKLSQLFKGYPNWKEAIGTGDGRCWLKIDT